jgi:hypothetical protein
MRSSAGRALSRVRSFVRARGSLGAGWWLAVVVVLVCHAFWQGHGLFDPAFRNPDVAGIAYNARLLLAGKLPYLDSAEIKPPGAFLLFAPLLELGGMRAVWGAAVLWGAALSLATGALASVVFRRQDGPRAAVLHAAAAAIANDADINYSFWMALPFTLAAATACAGAVDTRRSRRVWLFAASGFLALFAVAIKPSAWPLLFLFAVLLGREFVLGSARTAIESTLAGGSGALAAAVLVASPFLWLGRLDVLFGGLASVGEFGSEYVAIVRHAAGGRLRAVLQGLPCVVEQMPGLLVLAAAGCAELFPRRGPKLPLAFAAWVFAALSLAGLTFTLRFYSHDNVQLWPALAVLAVRPAGLIGRLLDRLPSLRRYPPVALPVALVLGLFAAWPGFDQRWGFVHWMAERDHMVAGICAKLKPRLPPDEPVLAWGWSAWSLYEHCERRAPGRVFKVISTITTVNTNTCNNGYGPMRLRNGPEPKRFLDEVRRRPPSLFLWSAYFKELGTDPLDEFTGLREFLSARYTIVETRGPYVAHLRNDLVPGPELAELQSFEAGNGGYGWSGRAGSVWTSTSRTPENLALMASMTQCVTR